MLDPADLLDARGLGFGAHGERCAALGVPALTSATDVAACVTREHRCRGMQMLEIAIPRLDELLGLGSRVP